MAQADRACELMLVKRCHPGLNEAMRTICGLRLSPGSAADLPPTCLREEASGTPESAASLACDRRHGRPPLAARDEGNGV